MGMGSVLVPQIRVAEGRLLAFSHLRHHTRFFKLPRPIRVAQSRKQLKHDIDSLPKHFILLFIACFFLHFHRSSPSAHPTLVPSKQIPDPEILSFRPR